MSESDKPGKPDKPDKADNPHWLTTWLKGAPSRWLGRGSGVSQDLVGGADMVGYVRNLARGNNKPREFAPELQPGARPVLVIHGFLGTRGSMYFLERRLIESGFVVISFHIGTFNTRDIRRSAFLIHRKVESVLASMNVDELDIIGHSMGGLIGLYYIKKLGGARRVRRLIMLGTPVHGTWAALAGVATLGLWSTSSWQLLPRSRFLDELRQGPLPANVDVYSIAAARDWIVPPKTTRLSGANAVTVPLGHSSLVLDEAVFTRVEAILRSPLPSALREP